MKNNIKNLRIEKYTISKLQMKEVHGGVQGSCVPTCNTTDDQQDKTNLPTIIYK